MLSTFLCVAAAFVATINAKSITNGTCYWKAGEEMDDIYSPCGNTISGNYPCCQLGDKFNLEGGSCVYGTVNPITYVAGCTDPTYSDLKVCPDKHAFADQQWVGLVKDGCEQLGNGNQQWGGCVNDGSARVEHFEGEGNCTCNSGDPAMFYGPSGGLTAIGYLPKVKMGDINWIGAYGTTTDPIVAPTTRPMDSSTLTSSSISSASETTTTFSSSSSSDTPTTESASSASSSTISDFTAAATASATSGEELSSGSKIGLGIGLAAAASVGILIGYCIFRYSRKKKQNPQTSNAFTNGPDNEKHAASSGSEAATLHTDSTHPGAIGSEPKFELPASVIPPPTVSPSITSSMDQDNHQIVYKPFRYQKAGLNGITEAPETKESAARHPSPYEAYRAGRATNTMDLGQTCALRSGRDEKVHELPG